MDYIDYDDLKNQGTGSHDVQEAYKFILYPFGRYEIIVKLTSDNEFLGIVGLRVNKSFLNYKQKMSKGYHDVEELYQE